MAAEDLSAPAPLTSCANRHQLASGQLWGCSYQVPGWAERQRRCGLSLRVARRRSPGGFVVYLAYGRRTGPLRYGPATPPHCMFAFSHCETRLPRVVGSTALKKSACIVPVEPLASEAGAGSGVTFCDVTCRVRRST